MYFNSSDIVFFFLVNSIVTGTVSKVQGTPGLVSYIVCVHLTCFDEDSVSRTKNVHC